MSEEENERRRLKRKAVKTTNPCTVSRLTPEAYSAVNARGGNALVEEKWCVVLWKKTSREKGGGKRRKEEMTHETSHRRRRRKRSDPNSR